MPPDTKASLVLKNGMHKAVAQGHPWVYRTQIEIITGDPSPGDAVTVLDFRGRYLGAGLYNPHSMITVRILTQSHETISASLIESRIRAAIAFRRQFWRLDTDSYRLVFGEADRLPGFDRRSVCPHAGRPDLISRYGAVSRCHLRDVARRDQT